MPISSPFTVVELEGLIDRYGVESSRWPDPERQYALELIDTSPEARDVYDTARSLKQSLRRAPVKAPPGLVDKIMSTITSGGL